MSKLNVDQRTIFDLFSDRKSDFLIPDYQRPYAWRSERSAKHCGMMFLRFLSQKTTIQNLIVTMMNIILALL